MSAASDMRTPPRARNELDMAQLHPASPLLAWFAEKKDVIDVNNPSKDISSGPSKDISSGKRL